MIIKEDLSKFEKWLKSPTQGIKLHQTLAIKRHKGADGYGVYANAEIKEDTIVMQVPKSAILSPRTTAISNILDSADLEPMTACCLAFLYERSKGTESPWHEYIRICPESVAISKLWSKDDQLILKGTEVAMVGGTFLRDFKETFLGDVKPLLKRYQDELGLFSGLSFKEFAEGMSTVGSRAFEVDAYHGLAMCPFADMLDHERDEHVHFQTTFDVCPECGEEGGCEHDPDESDEDQDDDNEEEEDKDIVNNMSALAETVRHNPVVPNKATVHSHSQCSNGNCRHDGADVSSDEDEDDTCDFTVVRAIRAGSQVYNTYGDLGNDVLLARYGFALPDNPFDNISLGPEVVKLHPQYLDWWSVNGNNLMQALHPLTLTINHDSKTSNQKSIDSPLESTLDSDSDSFMDTTEDTSREEEEGEEDLEDSCSIEYEGHPSPHCIIYLFLSTLPMESLESKSGPEVKAYIQVLVGTWRYIQPGRMPLPAYLFHDALRTCLGVIRTLQQLVQQRKQRYAIPHEKIDRKRTDRKYVYARMVRDCEQQIMARSVSYLSLLESACQWLLERDT